MKLAWTVQKVSSTWKGGKKKKGPSCKKRRKEKGESRHATDEGEDFPRQRDKKRGLVRSQYLKGKRKDRIHPGKKKKTSLPPPLYIGLKRRKRGKKKGGRHQEGEKGERCPKNHRQTVEKGAMDLLGKKGGKELPTVPKALKS